MASPFWTQSVSEVEASLKTILSEGLSEKEALQRKEIYGENALPAKDGVHWWKILLDQFVSIIIWLLIGAAIVAGFLGEWIDAWAILAIVILNALLGFLQEFRAERTMEALAKLSASISKVVRGGRLKSLPSKELVPGDIVLLEAGDRVPGDGRIVQPAQLSIDEASLTGESTAVSKIEQPLENDLALGDRINMAYMGTVVMSGKGFLIVTEIGGKTEMGKIATSLLEQKRTETPLQKRLNHLGKRLVYGCLIIVAVVFLLGLLRGSPIVDMLLTALSLAVAAIPEGLPAVVTITLSIGVKRLVEKNALIRRLSSVETLGSTKVICTDKTGTLTQNVMQVREIFVDNAFITVSGEGYAPYGEFSKITDTLKKALTIGTLCNNANIFQEEGEWIVAGDPTEGALLAAAAKLHLEKKALEKEYPYTQENTFDSERKMMSVLRKNTLFTKGAFDVLISHSKFILLNGEEVLLDETLKRALLEANKTLVSKAYRVLGVAYKAHADTTVEEDLVFVGLIGMMDPPRPEVKEALRECDEAGIRTVMVTGDHKGTAIAIARELGMNWERAIEGREIASLLSEQIKEINVFARISPEHKLSIIDAYKADGQVVAMTGDGVNDAPAIQAADIGISMGITGTDVTKEAADMILLDDNFATIVRAVKEGRGIYDNIVKFVGYLLAANMAEILVIFIALLLGFTTSDGRAFVPLLPVQLLWMNLVTDGFPAISLAFDPIDPAAMRRPPRSPKEAILNKQFALYLFSISTLITIGTLIVCRIGLKTSGELAHTLTFTTLIVLELLKVQLVRIPYHMSLLSNKFLLLALASSFLLQLLVLYTPSLNIVFQISALSLEDWGLIAMIAIPFYGLGRLLAKIFYKI